MNEKTIFQKIIDREIPVPIVYEDEHFFAFLDINPVTKGHTLLITKEPYRWMQDVPDTVLGEIFICSKRIIHAMKESLGCDLVSVVVEGKEVPHFHIHLIPGDMETKNAVWNHTSYEEGEQKVYADKIRNSLI